MPEYQIHHGDCIDVIPTLPEVDAIVCDPPYSLSFMGKAWDDELPSIDIWMECLSVLRPGGYLLAFGGTRTYHRLACSIEDAGFEIRDSILTNTYLAWVTGQGFPKGKGCLKPAWEPIVLARKPGKKVLPLGIAECKVGTEKVAGGNGSLGRNGVYGHMDRDSATATVSEGRWPPNLLLVHHPDCGESCDASCVVRTLGGQSGVSRSSDRARHTKARENIAKGAEKDRVSFGHDDTGTAARFFPQFKYQPKASRRDRNEGCEGMEAKACGVMQDDAYRWEYDGKGNKIDLKTRQANHHPCVKPTPLLEWLVRLACPEGGVCLDPFMGSGSTGKACMRAGRRFIGIEMDEQWLPIARARIEHERARTPLIAEAG